MRTLVVLLVLCATACATTVTGTAVDANGNPYTGTVSAFLLAYSPPTSGGKPVNRSIGPFTLAANGTFSLTMVGTDVISPSGSVWQFTFCGPSVPNLPYNPSQTVCFDANPMAIVGPSVDITTAIASQAKMLGPRSTNIGFNPATVSDPYRDIRFYGGHCYNIDSTLTPPTAFRDAAIASGVGQLEVRVPPNCPIRVADQIQLQGSDVPDGWRITGGPGSSVCGTAAFATTGPIVLVNRTGHWKWDVSITGTCSGDQQNISTGGLEWDNNGSTGSTSTAASIGGSSSYLSGGVFVPPAPSEGSQFVDLFADVAFQGTNSNFLPTIEQDATSTVATGTQYTITVDAARRIPGYGNVLLAFYVCASAPCNQSTGTLKADNITVPTSTVSWSTATLSWTADAGSNGKILHVLIGNLPPFIGFTAIDTQGDDHLLIDNVRTTNFTLSQGNAGFETPIDPTNTFTCFFPANTSGCSSLLWAVDFVHDNTLLALQGYPTDGSQVFANRGDAVYVGHPFVPALLTPWIPIRIGNCTGNPANCSTNLEQSTIQGVSVNAGGLAGTAGILFDPALCCDEGWNIGGPGEQRVNIGNAADGIKGPVTGECQNIYSSNVAGYTTFGAGHAQINGSCSTVNNASAEPGGPLYRSTTNPGSVIFENLGLPPYDVAPGECDIQLAGSSAGRETQFFITVAPAVNDNTTTLVCTVTGATEPAKLLDLTAGMYGGNSSPLKNHISADILASGYLSFDTNRIGLLFTATSGLINGNTGVNSPLLNFTGFYWNGSTGFNHDTTTFGQIVLGSGAGYFAFNHTEGAGAGGIAFGPPIFGGLTINALSPLGALDGVSNVGTAGSTSDTYHVLACGSGGCTTIESSTVSSSTSTANATLSSTNFNRIQWRGTMGAAYFKIRRDAHGQAGITTDGVIGKVYVTCPQVNFSITACPNAEGSQQASYFFNDTGINGDGSPLPTVNASNIVSGQAAQFAQYAFANLPPFANGTIVFCTDCKNLTDDGATFDSAAAAAGHGTNVLRENGAWRVH